MGDCLRVGVPPRHVASHLGQLSLPSLRGRLNRVAAFTDLGYVGRVHLCRVAGNTVWPRSSEVCIHKSYIV